MPEIEDTIDRIAHHHGPGSKGLVWAHNTHIGDARATDMARAGMVNIGQLMRRHHSGEVLLAGFASYSGTVTASEAWGASEQIMTMPNALPGSHEDLLNQGLGEAALLMFGPDRTRRCRVCRVMPSSAQRPLTFVSGWPMEARARRRFAGVIL